MYSGGCLYRRKFQLNSQKSEASDKNASSSFAASLFPFATDFFLVGSGDVSGVFDVFSEFFLDFRVTFLPSIDTFYRVIQVIRMIQLLQIFNSYLEKNINSSLHAIQKWRFFDLQPKILIQLDQANFSKTWGNSHRLREWRGQGWGF